MILLNGPKRDFFIGYGEHEIFTWFLAYTQYKFPFNLLKFNEPNLILKGLSAGPETLRVFHLNGFGARGVTITNLIVSSVVIVVNI